MAWDAQPLAASTRVTTSVNARPVTRHVVVLSLARMADIAIPEEHEPWMAATDTLPFQCEWAWRIDPRHPDEVSKEMTKIGNRVDGQVEHWLVDHGKRPPKQLARQAEHRATVEDEQRRGFTHLSTRTRGWYRIAVSGATEREALDRAAEVVELYKPHTKWVRDLGQYALAREFVPGEPLSSSAHCRHFPVVKVAAGLPAVTAEVGDRRGFHIGETAGLSARAVCFDPWYLPEVIEASGVVPILGVQGSGKSALMGMLCYKSALSGARGVAMDPAGRLQRMLTLPELTGIAHQVDVLGGVPGSLSPYAAVPEPNHAIIWADATDADDFRDKLLLERAAVRQTRRDLALMTLRWSLPIELNRNPDVLTRLRAAVSAAPAEPASTLWAPIAHLQKGDELAVTIARQLLDASERELGRLFYPVRHKTVDAVQVPSGARFTVFNLKGLVKPDESCGAGRLHARGAAVPPDHVPGGVDVAAADLPGRPARTQVLRPGRSPGGHRGLRRRAHPGAQAAHRLPQEQQRRLPGLPTRPGGGGRGQLHRRGVRRAHPVRGRPNRRAQAARQASWAWL